MRRKIQAICAAAGMLATVTTIPSYAATSSQYVETNHGWVSYHVQPALRSAILGHLTLGQEALLLGRANSYWYKVQVNNRTVYITTNGTYTHVVTQSSPAPTSTTSSQPTTPSPTSTSPTSTSTEPQWQVEADKVIAAGKTQLGVPYLWGKQEPGIGFDCSNFTAWCYKAALGISFSGSSVYQRYNVGTPVPLNQIREGDLLFFKTANNASGAGHVGIYAGNGYILQEGGGYAKVTYQPMANTWFATNLVFARRIIN